MSSLRNSIQRRPHRERAQPLERRRLGLLEKHKDYSLRAKDFNKKKAQLKALREKAALRNEDEFYFGMLSRKGPGSRLQGGKRWVGTVEGDRGNKALSVEAVRLYKTQDLGYVRTMKQVARREVERLEERVVLTKGLDRLDEEEEEAAAEDDDDDFEDEDEPGTTKFTKSKGPRKIVFCEDEDEREHIQEERSSSSSSSSSSNNRNSTGGSSKNEQALALKREKSARQLQSQLTHARKKVRTLGEAETALEVQKAKMAKTATSGGTTRRGKKIMVRRRKR